MTSTPLRQFFPTLGVVILLGFFLYSMTAPTTGSQEAAHAVPAAPTADIPTVITVRCAHRPEALSISCGGRLLWQPETPGLYEETECGLPLKDGSVILTVSARWPETRRTPPSRWNWNRRGNLPSPPPAGPSALP